MSDWQQTFSLDGEDVATLRQQAENALNALAYRGWRLENRVDEGGGGGAGTVSSYDIDLVPNDNSASVMTQNHALITSALAGMSSTGGHFVFGAGVFYVDTNNDGPLLYYPNTTISGLNRIASRVQGNGASAVLSPARGTTYSTDSANRTTNVLFHNLGVWNTSAATAGGIAIDARQVSNSYFEYLDVRQSETGIRLGNVCYSNEFSQIQASGCDNGFHATNGSNENSFVKCRASGVEIGFLFEDGANAAMNNVTIDRCTIETFSTVAIRLDHSATAGDDFDNFRILNTRMTSGTTGIDLIEQGAGEITNLLIVQAGDDSVTNILNWEIGGNTYVAGNAAVLTAMRGARNFLMIHGGKLWPVRPGFHNSVESNSALLMYTDSASRVAVRGSADTTNGDLVANDITNATNGAGTERVNYNRLRVSGPTAHVAGDYAASAGFGTSPTITPASNSTDSRGRVSITADTTTAANPTLTLTFQDGAWPSAPFVTCSRGDTESTAGEWRVTSTTTTTAVFTFVGTPTATETYILDFAVIG